MAKKIRAKPAGDDTFLIKSLVVTAVLLLLASGWFWFAKIYKSPRRVFEAMLLNSLSTPGVTRHVSQTSGANSLDQYIQISLGANNRSRTLSDLKQSNGQISTQVITENVGMLDADYSRYTQIITNQKSANGKPLNFSKLLNVWAKSNVPSSGQKPSPQYFNESLFGAVPMADLPLKQRSDLAHYIISNRVFDTDYAAVTRQRANGRSVYVYHVVIQPQAYVAMLQAFTKAVGLGSVAGIDQNSYQGAAPLQAEISVDPLSRQLTSVHYLQNDRREDYSGYGAKPVIDVPSATISFAELQSRLQNLQQQ